MQERRDIFASGSYNDFSGDTILLIHTFYCGKNGVFSLPKTSSITPIRHLPQGNLIKSLFTMDAF